MIFVEDHRIEFLSSSVKYIEILKIKISSSSLLLLFIVI